jgi:arsenate reductase
MNAKSFTSNIIIGMLAFALACNNEQTKQEETMETNKQVENNNPKLLASLENYLADIESAFEQIPEERKKLLSQLSAFIKSKNSLSQKSNLIFICTHNSRRSHMSQLWAQVAAFYYGVENVHCYSGGTEATAFNPRSVKALEKAGFQVEQTDSSSNPVYLVKYADGVDPVKGFSKKYDDEFNPRDNFAAIMTCSDADEACPIVIGADKRFAIKYEDPKVADNTPQEEERYDERCRQICVEMFYAFSKVKD